MYLLADQRKATHNSTYKKLAVQWLNQHLCFVSSSVNLSSDTYNLFQDQIKQEKAEKEQRLFDLRKKLSNSEMFINEAIDIARNIKYY
jgi:hypothetical protein